MRHVKAPPGAKPPYPLPDIVTKGVPAPTDGWDAISPLADMDPKRAPILINWVPRPGWCELRQGASLWVGGLGNQGPVETLAAYRRADVNQVLIAATAGNFYDVSLQNGTGTLLASGFSSNRWQFTNFTSPGEITVITFVNGVDTAQQLNGTAWSAANFTGFPNGWNTTNIINIFGGKQRLWFTMKNSTICAFMPVGNITGAIAGFQDLGTILNKGGFLQAVCDWTIDAGEGPNSYTAFISSEGQVAVYQGIDPTNTSLWSFVGTFNMAKPIGFRCFTQMGTDIALITYQGLIPISQALPYDPSADRSAALTARIQNAMNQAVQTWATNFGWQFITFPLQTLGILNVPQQTNETQVQYVTNMLTGAWTQFTGWDANCFELFNQLLMYGDNEGNVVQAYLGGADIDQVIEADMQCAFNWFDDPGRNKHMKLIQPLITSNGEITPSISVDADFADTAPIVATSNTTMGGSLWGVGTWGNAQWTSGNQQITSWLGVTANQGKALAIRLIVNAIPGGTEVPRAVFGTAVWGESMFGDYSTDTLVLQINAFNTVMELGGYL